MRYTLDRFDRLPPALVAKLAEQGITHTDALLDRAAVYDQRAELAASTGVPAHEIARAAQLADLVRIKGVGIKLAQLLVLSAKAATVKDIAKCDPDILRVELLEANRLHDLLSAVPSRLQIAGCIEEARELRPRLALEKTSVDEFADHVRRVRCKQRKAQSPVNRAMLALAFAIVALGLAALTLVNYLALPDTTGLPEPVAGILDDLLRARLWYRVGSGALVISLSMLALVSALRLWRAWCTWHNLGLALRLFRRPVYQRAYLRMEDVDLSSAVRALWISGGVWMTIVVWIVVAAIRAPDDETMLASWRLPMHLLGTVMIVVAFVPDVAAFLTERKSEGRIGLAASQRFLLWRLLSLAAGIGVGLLTVRALIPGALVVHRFVVSAWVSPAYFARIERGRAQLKDALAEMPDYLGDEALADSVVDALLVDGESNLALLVDEDGQHPETPALRLCGTVGVWMLGNAALVYFVAPFIILGEPFRALIFIGLTALSFYSEEFLQDRLRPAFYLPEGSLVGILLLAVIILANTILYDAIYQGATEKYHLCPFCQGEVASASTFCSSCGAKQIEKP